MNIELIAIASVWILLWVMCIIIDNKEYEIILKSGHYRLMPTCNIERLAMLILSPVFIFYVTRQYFRTKREMD